MTRDQGLRIDMFRNVQEFGRKHGEAFTKSSVGGKAFAAIGAAVNEIDRLTTARVRTDDEGLAAKAAARDAIAAQLKEVARTARLAAQEAPDEAPAFKVPAWKKDAGLIAAARAVIRDGRAAAPLLAPLGLPGTFVEHLETLVERFVEAERDRKTGRLDRTAARTGLAAAIASAATALRKLDVVIANTFKTDAVALAEWKHVRHWTLPRAAATEAPPAPEPAPAPQAPVVDAAAEPTLRKVS